MQEKMVTPASCSGKHLRSDVLLLVGVGVQGGTELHILHQVERWPRVGLMVLTWLSLHHL